MPYILILIALAALGIVMVIRKMIKIKKHEASEIVKYHYFRIICVVIMTASWIFNFGWYRVFLTWIGLPVVHSVLFSIVNSKAISKITLCPKFKIYSILSCVTYLMAYLLLPDGGDIGPSYLFFGLIRSDAAFSMAMSLSMVCFAAHFVILIVTVVALIRVKKVMDKDKTSEDDKL